MGSSAYCISALGPAGSSLVPTSELPPLGYPLVTCSSTPPDLEAAMDREIEDQSCSGLSVARSACLAPEDSSPLVHRPPGSGKVGSVSAIQHCDRARLLRSSARRQTCSLHHHSTCIGFSAPYHLFCSLQTHLFPPPLPPTHSLCLARERSACRCFHLALLAGPAKHLSPD